MAEFPSSSVADGVWTLKQQRRALLGSAWPVAAPTDQYFANVSLLLHGDGTDGSTTFTDSSSNNLTVTANGNAQIDTAVVKYGTGSMQFGAVGNYISVAADTALTFGSGDFTIEFWVYLNTLSDNDSIISQGTSSQSDNWQLAYISSRLYFYYSNQSASLGSTSFSTGQWYHIAMVGEGSTIKIYVDGTLDDTVNYSYNYGSYVTRVGINRGGTENLDGYIDDLRITKGIARYTANFTPPTAPFPDQ